MHLTNAFLFRKTEGMSGSCFSREEFDKRGDKIVPYVSNYPVNSVHCERRSKDLYFFHVLCSRASCCCVFPFNIPEGRQSQLALCILFLFC